MFIDKIYNFNYLSIIFKYNKRIMFFRYKLFEVFILYFVIYLELFWNLERECLWVEFLMINFVFFFMIVVVGEIDDLEFLYIKIFFISYL